MFIINEPELAQHCMKVVRKLWGTEFWIVNNEKYCCKILKINPGYRSSVHAHKSKDEMFIGVRGTVMLTMGSKVFPIEPGKNMRIKPGQFHSFQASNAAWIMEVSTPHDDQDVIRIEESKKLEES